MSKETNNLIGIKLNEIRAFEVLLDSEPSSDMIICKNEEEAERSLYQEYMRAIYQVRDQYHQAVNKIRRVK